MSSDTSYLNVPVAPAPRVNEQDIETDFIAKLRDLKYTYRPDIRDRAALERNFREKFEALNRVQLTDAEFARLLDDLVSPDVFKNSVRLREKNDFTRDDGTPLTYTLVNIKDWCKNDFEVVPSSGSTPTTATTATTSFSSSTASRSSKWSSKTLGVSPRRAMEQIIEYKNDPGNGYIWHTTGSSKTLTSFKASIPLGRSGVIHEKMAP